MSDKGDRLDKALEKGLELVKKKAAEEQLEFPFWPDFQMAIPNDFTRSALFTARKKTGGEVVRDHRVYSQEGIIMIYSGPVLTQDHLDVYEAIIRMARNQGGGIWVHFTAYSLLKSMGRGTSGKELKLLRKFVSDLAFTNLEITNEHSRLAHSGSLLPQGIRDIDTDHYRYQIHAGLIAFFKEGFTRVQIKQRKKLARSPLAKYLQAYVTSHRKPFPITVEMLYKITGSNAKELYHFRANLRTALAQLVNVGVLKRWTIDDTDKVHFHMPAPVDKSK